MSSLACWASRPAIRWSAAEHSPLPDVVARHASSCVRCQAESARTRLAIRETARAFSQPQEPPAGLVGAVMAGTLAAAPTGWRPSLAVSATAVATGVTLFLVARARLSSD